MLSLLQRIDAQKLAPWVAAYVAGAWLLLQMVGLLSDTLAWPAIVPRSALAVLAAGALATPLLARSFGRRVGHVLGGAELLTLAGFLAVAGVAVAWARDDAPLANAASVGESDRSSGLSGPRRDSADGSAVAILPLLDVSPDGAGEYFADGMTEGLTNAVGRVPGLRVVSADATLALKDRNLDARGLGRELGADRVVESSVRRDGDRLRVRAQIVDVERGRPTWSETYERRAREVFELQEEMSRDIAGALGARIGAGERSLVGEPTRDMEAYDLYLKARFSWRKRTEDDLLRAVELLRQATSRDPRFAQAYAGLADAYLSLGVFGFRPAAEMGRQARAAAERALVLDPTLPEAHTSLGSIMRAYDFDWKGSEREYLHAIRLNESYAPAHHWYGLELAANGRFDEGLVRLRRAHRLDPVSPNINAALAGALYMARRHDEAVEEGRKASAAHPDYAAARLTLALALGATGWHAEAFAEQRKAIEVSGGSTAMVAALGALYGRAGDVPAARKILSQLGEPNVYTSPYFMAALYASLEEPAAAVAWLERAYEERADWIYFVGVDPQFDGLRGRPEFARLLGRLGLEVGSTAPARPEAAQEHLERLPEGGGILDGGEVAGAVDYREPGVLKVAHHRL